MIQLDTHVAIWLHTRRLGRLSSDAARLTEREPCQVSAAVLLELEILHERRRIPEGANAVLAVLQQRIGLTVSRCAFADVADAALKFGWTHDPFDRLIVANAIADGVRLVTADETILANFRAAVW